MPDLKQKYPPGSVWLYIRIYGGSQALEEWMISALWDLLSEWKRSGLVKLFHFIHYLDPQYHLRLRFQLSDPTQAGILLSQLQCSCRDWLDEDLMWKIEVGTYEPEYDRYGPERMGLVESWFEIDSLFWFEKIKCHSAEGCSDMWKIAMQSIDVFLNDFGAVIDDKSNIINKLRDSAATLFGLNKVMKGQLDVKYRRISSDIVLLFDKGVAIHDVSLAKRSADASGIVKKLQESFSDRSALFESIFLPDLVHMSLNRAFRTRHRMQELVLFDFLSRYYESARAIGANSAKAVTSDE